MHDRVGAELERDLCNRFGDHRSRQGGDERILPFVECVREQRLRHLLVGECLLAVEQQHVVRACELAAIDGRVKTCFLADVDEDGDHFLEAVVLLQPRNRAARVEPARVGEDSDAVHWVSPSR